MSAHSVSPLRDERKVAVWPITAMDRALLALRWAMLVLAVGLSFIDRSKQGVFVPSLPLAGILVIYNLAILLIGRLLPWLRQPFNVMALDGLMATLAIYLNGGYHSAFFVLYIFVLLNAAFRFSIVGSMLLANLVGFLYVAACLLNPAGLNAPQALDIFGTKLILLLLIAFISSLLLEQLRVEHQATARERALLEAQSSFISAISHELRTPLTCIKTSIELLQASKAHETDENECALLQTIADHTARLEKLVTDLLQMIRLEAGQLELTRQPTDLAVLLRRAAAALEPLQRSKGQSLELDLPEGLPRAWIDRERIEQVAANLLSNAIKFTPTGGHIRLTLRHIPNEKILAVTVSDNGPGIAPEERERLFTKFYTGRRASSGIGLGLYLAKQLVELHGGHITVESTPGQGSTFAFTIPLEVKKDETADRG
nr:HAMP domain-containing histidine kinase [Chloroflexota bacterium]